MHSLGASDFLKIEKTNNILFDMRSYDNRKIMVQEQYTDKNNLTQFMNLYGIKIVEITLRELLTLQSIYQLP